jgi:glycosyltransferase involved in cell wall biosynthesis
MTKLIIQIPCFNEEETLPGTLAELPRKLPGVDVVEWLVVDDGSRDRTVEVARELGVDHVVRLPRNRGLARAFMAGIRASLEAGADFIVNTDADNQYRAADIPLLLEPILKGEAELVVGARPIGEIRHFSFQKRTLQRLGSWVTRILSGTEVSDAVSGFRALSRRAAMQLHVFNEYTYTVETLIQAGQKGMAVLSVPIGVNPDQRPSRLVRSTPRYVLRQATTMLRIFVTYRPFRFFALLGTGVFLVGFLLGLRFLYFYLNHVGSGHVQSVILAALLLGIGIFLFLVGLLADLIAVNRRLLEDMEARLQRMEERL